MLSEKAKNYLNNKKRNFMKEHELKDNCGGDTLTYLVNKQLLKGCMKGIEKSMGSVIEHW